MPYPCHFEHFKFFVFAAYDTPLKDIKEKNASRWKEKTKNPYQPSIKHFFEDVITIFFVVVFVVVSVGLDECDTYTHTHILSLYLLMS
jgi:hypothetical protein